MKKNFNKGLILTSLGSFWWGFIGVIYFEYVSFIGHIELVVHRCLWTAVMLIITTTIFSKWKLFLDIASNIKNLIMLFFSGLLIFILNTDIIFFITLTIFFTIFTLFRSINIRHTIFTIIIFY